ncbi:SGNH/GDSL hydrolase family protein [Fusobacterium ulcerans]|uniref:SGNH/GDSL hydrolase family protein n=1 Tax=Fusobacterium ulcerans TaxID=861 RepID=UPI002E7967D2|nr:SGNH/GDSL hydrolase family protein [Fusobacterium ulcerans]MEE0137744.1 SGNH/GDSL hydrolase family protein [Fusobacterium ulcerans]
MQENINIPDSTITSALTFRNLVLMNMQQLTNFPYIENDFDALTDYELLCLVVKYLNDVIDNQNEQNDSITNMYNAFLALQTYVNNTKDTLEDAFNNLDDYVRNYFANLDVQEEINVKLESMAESGELTTLIANYVDPIYQAYETEINADIADFKSTVNDTVSTLSTNVTTLSGAVSAESVARITEDTTLSERISTIVASAGTAGDSSSEIVEARTNEDGLTFSTLCGRIDYIENTTPFKQNMIQNGDLNALTYACKALITNPSNSPFGSTSVLLSSQVVNVANKTDMTSNNYIMQTVYKLDSSQSAPLQVAFRTINRTAISPSPAYHYGAWNILDYNMLNTLNITYSNLVNGNIARTNLNGKYASNGIISAQTDFNTLLVQGNYLMTSTSNTNCPAGLSVCVLSNELVDISSAGNQYIVQTAYDLQINSIYKRMIINFPANSSNNTYRDWVRVHPASSPASSLVGKKIVNFGDSIIGTFVGSGSIPNVITDITGATTYNVGFGGCQMSDRTNQYWKDFSMCALADAVASGDFSQQTADMADPDWTNKPDNGISNLNRLKAIDFSEIDYVTISYGTNDYTAGDVLDNENDPYDYSTVLGALRYSCKTLLEAYPNLKILVCSPIYRLFLSSSGGSVVIDATGDDRTYAGGYTLKELSAAMVNCAKEMHIPVLDAYNDLGLNSWNYTNFFTGTDGTHPNLNGRAELARLYAMKLLNL